MSDANPSEFLTDPLSEVTRKERRNLLAASTVGILVAKAGLVPTQLSTLGIQFTPPAQQTFVALLASVVIYFILAFAFYGVADFFVWRKKYQDYLVASAIEEQNWSQEDQRNYEEIHEGVPRAVWLYSMSKPVACFRVAFEFALPVIVGVVSVILLVLKVVCP